MRKFEVMSAPKVAGAFAVAVVASAVLLAMFVPSDNGQTRSGDGLRCMVPRGSGPGYDASIGNQQNNGSYCIFVDERLLVVLHSGSQVGSTWRDFSVSRTGVLTVAPITLMFPRGVTGMNFRAVHPGTVVISAQRPACSPAAVGAPTCGAVELWRARIIVQSRAHSPPVSSGVAIFGVVSAGPTCPVERVGNPCPPRPVSGTVDVRTGAGGVVATTRTDSKGRYSVSVKPGTYLLTVLTGSVFPRCPSRTVNITSKASVQADINCDTGIR